MIYAVMQALTAGSATGGAAAPESRRAIEAFAAVQGSETSVNLLTELGNFGDAHAVGSGVWELRIDYGPGYRVYYARSGTTTLLLLAGGEKSTQERDIRPAQTAWTEYQQRIPHV